MYENFGDLSMPNAHPGECAKCRGTGVYAWGAVVNGKPTKSGPCYSCKGTGYQERGDIKRNEAYNRHKLATMVW